VVSTWAFLAANPKSLISVDIINCPVAEVTRLAAMTDTDFQFLIHDSRTVKLPPMDLLFIDTDHKKAVIEVELAFHSPNVSKYIIMHDTMKNDMWPGIEEFLERNKEWKLKEHYKYSYGLGILERTDVDIEPVIYEA
jgi:hypothetical protein